MSYTFIDWETLNFKKTSGKEKIRCPECDESRSDKRDKSLQVNHNEGYAKCHYCETLSFKKDELISPTDRTYSTPPQDWVNHTSLSDGMVKWCSDERKIRQETLIKFGVTEETFYQPKRGREVVNLVFNYFEGDRVVNKKYRDGGKNFTQTTDGKPILYNINSIIGEKEAWIVEGEFDVLALDEIGISNVVSLPNGANDNDAYWINSQRYLKDVESFIIATDNDSKGIEIREKIAQRLGRYRCRFIEWEKKDANGDLVEGVLEKTVKTAKRFPVGGTHTISDLHEGILALRNNGLPETISPMKECFGDLHEIFSVMMGHLVTVTGIPSHGKSSFTDWYLLNIVHEFEKKLSIFSPEHNPLELHASNYMRMAVGKPMWGEGRASEGDIERFRDWANERIYFTSPENGEFPTWNWLLDKFKEQIYTFGINIFLIDAFNKLSFAKGESGKDAIDKVLTKLTLFAQMHNALIFLIAHPTKMKKDDTGKYEMPTLYDVSGSSDFRNQTHDGYCIYRNFATEVEDGSTTFVNLKTKFPWQGEIGARKKFEYDTFNARFYAIGNPPYREDMTLSEEEKEQLPSPNIFTPPTEEEDPF